MCTNGSKNYSVQDDTWSWKSFCKKFMQCPTGCWADTADPLTSQLNVNQKSYEYPTRWSASAARPATRSCTTAVRSTTTFIANTPTGRSRVTTSLQYRWSPFSTFSNIHFCRRFYFCLAHTVKFYFLIGRMRDIAFPSRV